MQFKFKDSAVRCFLPAVLGILSCSQIATWEKNTYSNVFFLGDNDHYAVVKVTTQFGSSTWDSYSTSSAETLFVRSLIDNSSIPLPTQMNEHPTSLPSCFPLLSDTAVCIASQIGTTNDLLVYNWHGELTTTVAVPEDIWGWLQPFTTVVTTDPTNGHDNVTVRDLETLETSTIASYVRVGSDDVRLSVQPYGILISHRDQSPVGFYSKGVLLELPIETMNSSWVNDSVLLYLTTNTSARILATYNLHSGTKRDILSLTELPSAYSLNPSQTRLLYIENSQKDDTRIHLVNIISGESTTIGELD